MRVKILKEFRDKFNPTRIYEPGTYAEFDDEARVTDLVTRGLAAREELEAETKADVNTGEKTDVETDGKPEVKAEAPKKKRK